MIEFSGIVGLVITSIHHFLKRSGEALTPLVQRLLTPSYRDLDCPRLKQVRSEQITKLDHTHSEERGKKILPQRRSAKGQGPKRLAKEGN